MKSDNKISIFFLGRGPIAERCFLLCKDVMTVDIKGVCSNDRFKEKFLKETNDIPFISNKKRNEDAIADIVKGNKVDFLISVQHPWIFSKDLLDKVDNRAFNLHNAKLPEYQGFNSISHAILNGDTTYTTTIHWIVPIVDSGPIAFEETIDIDKKDTAKMLYDKTVEASAKNFINLIEHLINKQNIPKRQATGRPRFYKKDEIIALKKIDNIIEYEEVNTKIRAFSFPPHEPAYFCLNNERFYLSKNHYLRDSTYES